MRPDVANTPAQQPQSNATPQIPGIQSPLDVLVNNVYRLYGEHSPDTVDGEAKLMFIGMANKIIDKIRIHPYYTGNPVLDYYLTLQDVRPVKDVIMERGLLFEYALLQGSEKLESFQPDFYDTLNRQMQLQKYGNSRFAIRITDGGTNR